jgi:hypothetical protein
MKAVTSSTIEMVFSVPEQDQEWKVNVHIFSDI